MDSEEYSLVVSSGLLKEVLVMTVLLIDVMTSVLIIVIVRVPINLLSRPPLVVITTVTRVTILPRTTIILYILKLTTHILKPRVYVESVLNLILKPGLDSIVRDSLNVVNINFSVIISLNGVNINLIVNISLKLI
jgi:hypothetical protein